MNVAVIFAGGVGSRMGSDVPKQFLEWDNKAIIVHTLLVFERHKDIHAIVVACKEEWIGHTWDLARREGLRKLVSIVPGGTTALDSQLNGLREVKRLYPSNEVTVLIHDGVRPLVDAATISRNIDSVGRYGNAITATPAIETILTMDDRECVGEVLDRRFCRMARAPQSFMLDDILETHEQSLREGTHDFIDSATMMASYGHKLHVVDGEPENIKVTTPSDYHMFLGISRHRGEEERR